MISTGRFQVRTRSGYVGRWTVSGPLDTTLPQGRGYEWDEADAREIALRFGGEIQEVFA